MADRNRPLRTVKKMQERRGAPFLPARKHDCRHISTPPCCFSIIHPACSVVVKVVSMRYTGSAIIMDPIPATTPVQYPPRSSLLRGGFIGLGALLLIFGIDYFGTFCSGFACVSSPAGMLFMPMLTWLTVVTGVEFSSNFGGSPTILGLITLVPFWSLLGASIVDVRWDKWSRVILGVLVFIMFILPQFNPMQYPSEFSCRFVHGEDQWGSLQRQCYETLIRHSNDPAQCETLITRGYAPEERDKCYVQNFLPRGIEFDQAICNTMTSESWRTACQGHFPELAKDADCAVLQDPLAQRDCFINKIYARCPIQRYIKCDIVGQQNVSEHNACVRAFAREVQNPELCFTAYPTCDLVTKISGNGRTECEAYVNTP